VVATLRGLLVLAFVAILVLQVMSVPGALSYQAEQDPGFAAERWILQVVLEIELVCAQVVIVCTWQLLGMVRTDRIFTDAAFRWVDLILGAIAAGWLVWLGFGIYVLATSDDPGNPLAVGILGLAITVVGLLMLVMRALLRQATTLHTDMEAVI
jgi:Protein of unknown function (DUF2975)